MPFEIIRNDITKIKADAIVNTANPNVAIGDGVDSAIYNAAGREKLFQKRKQIGEIPFGEVKATPAYQLDAKYIFHASGPVWIDGKHNEHEILKSCYENCMKLALKKRCKSIAFPFMATGNYGFPRDEALRIAISVFGQYLMEYEIQIYLVVFDKKSYSVSTRLFSDVEAFIDEHYVEDSLAEEYGGHLPRALLPPCGAQTTQLNETEDCTYVLEFTPKPKTDSIDDAPKQSALRMPPAPVEKRGRRAAPAFQAAESMQNLDSYLQRMERPLTEYLQQLINKKGMINADVYKRANMDKKYFSKLINGKVKPTKLKLLSLAIALKLNLDETKDLLLCAGYALSPSSKSDLIFEYYIRKGEYDIFTIDITLFDYGLPTVVND